MKDFALVRKLVGPVEPSQLRYVDYAVTETLGVFMPVAGQCFYAVSPEHTHPAYLFTVNFDPYCRVRIGGKILDSVPSTVAMIPPDVPHQELPSDTVSRYLAVMIDKGYFDRQLTIYDCPEAAALCTEPVPVTERLVSALKEFMAEYEEAVPGYRMLLGATAQTVTHLLIRLLLGLSGESEKVTSRMSVNRAIEYVNAQFGARITVTDLSHVACLSPSHFSRVFREETGVSPADYIMKTRLDRAKRMLRAGDRSVTHIALQCGFNSSSYFSQCFLREYKVSPSQFKKSLAPNL